MNKAPKNSGPLCYMPVRLYVLGMVYFFTMPMVSRVLPSLGH